MPNVSLTAPVTDYSAESADIARRRKMAELMQQQGMTPLDQQTAGGYVVPTSWTQGLAKALQGGLGAYQQGQLKDEEKALGQRYQTELSDTLARATRAGTGSPEMQPATPMDDEGNINPVVSGAKPDRAAMARILMEHPGTAPLGMSEMTKESDNQRRSALLSSIMAGGGAPGAAFGGAGGAPAGSAFEGIPPQVVAMMTSGDPELVALGKSILAANEGVAARPGAPVVNKLSGRVIAQPTPAVPPGVALNIGPNGATASPVPGAIPAMAGVTGTQAAAKAAGEAPYQLNEVNLPGGPQLMTNQQRIEAATGAPMPQPGQTQRAPVPQRGPLDTPPPSAGVNQTDRARILQNELAAQQGMPASPERDRNVQALQTEIRRMQTPGLPLEDQGAAARQKAQGTAQGQLEAEKPQHALAARTALTNLERLNSIAGELAGHQGLPDIIGKVNQYSALDLKGATRDARALQSSLVKQMSTSSLQAMREASKTGGAVGAVTEKEWPILEQQWAAVDAAQTPEAYKVALQNLQNQMKGAMGRIRAAYQETHNEPLKFEPVPYQTQGRSRRATDAANPAIETLLQKYAPKSGG